MKIYSNIRNDIIKYFKNPEERNKAKELKIIIGELQRQPNKDITDGDIVKIIKKRIKEINELINIVNDKLDNSNEYINSLKEIILFLERYIPKDMVVDYNEIEEYIKNINFNELKNHKQAIGMVKKHFNKKYPNKELDIVTVCELVDKYGKN